VQCGFDTEMETVRKYVVAMTFCIIVFKVSHTKHIEYLRRMGITYEFPNSMVGAGIAQSV
jgi:hypothetical protein